VNLSIRRSGIGTYLQADDEPTRVTPILIVAGNTASFFDTAINIGTALERSSGRTEALQRG